MPAADPFVNGSFETGDYTGWTLNEDSGNAQAGAWGIGTNGQQLAQGQTVHDYNDNVDFVPSCLGVGTIPVLVSSDGNDVAFNTQGGPERHRIWQDITVPAGRTTLEWSMGYTNTQPFNLASQFLAIEVRVPSTDAITATLTTTDPTANPPLMIPMTPFSADLSAYVGQSIRITVDLDAQGGCFFAWFDGFGLH
jgi:hypothetical protein